MINLKKMNGESIYINPDLIRYIEKTPDTLITFLDGQQIMVRNSPEEISNQIIELKRKFFEPIRKANQS